MRKKVIILWHNGGRLANQLWLFVSVYAYCLEKGYKAENHSFFEYSRFFNVKSGNKIVDFLFFYPYFFLKKILPMIFYKNQHDYFFRWYYKIYVKLICRLHKNEIIYAEHDRAAKIHYLRPTKNTDIRLDEFENSGDRKIYLHGWLFRNPIGIEKYRREITAYFKPKDDIISPVAVFIKALRNKYKIVVGVHIRQGDYKTVFAGGKLFFNEDETCAALHQYLDFFRKNINDVCFVICSDGPIEMSRFVGLNVIKSDFNAIQDIYMLAQTDVIIGSDSTFGFFASYYGNIPLVILKKNGIDWQYYLDKSRYFNNKYSLFFDHNYE